MTQPQFKLPKFKSNTKTVTVRVIKTGFIGEVQKCTKEKDGYHYWIKGGEIWFSEKELTEVK